MISSVTKHSSNMTLAALGLITFTHSRFGTGELPEAMLAVLLFLAAFSNRRQPFFVVGVAMLAVGLTWAVNSGNLVHGRSTTFLSLVSIVLFAVLGFSRLIFGRAPKQTNGKTEKTGDRNM
jgi:hypothetical protein